MSAATARRRSNLQPLSVLVAVLLIAGVSIVAVGIRLHREEGALKDARNTLAGLARREDALRDQLSRWQRLHQAVDALGAAGFVTTQREPRWPQALRATGLAGVEVEVLRDPAMSTAALDGEADLIFRDSLVRVRMPVLHEGELLRLLDALSAAQAGIMRAQRCSLRRAVNESTRPTTPLLSAECEIGWTDAWVDAAESR